ncbi:hypothetical protein [Kitasatospora sp. NPDC059827]|uniref:hypothetical protein n=1 Tax=Kitasatospora sp. NPDC059827 TaxID=3346964 RepID=UPI00366214C1
MSYLDFGGAGRPPLALHGHLSGRSTPTSSRPAIPSWGVVTTLVGDHLPPITATDELAVTVREFLAEL